MKNKRRDGAQPEMKSLFKGHGDFPHQAERRGAQPLLCTGMPFMASQKHCLPRANPAKSFPRKNVHTNRVGVFYWGQTASVKMQNSYKGVL